MTIDLPQGSPAAPGPLPGEGLSPPAPWPLHLAYLVRWEMILLWRRRLVLVLGIILVVGYLLALAGLLLVNHAASQQTNSANALGSIIGLPGALTPVAVYASRVLPLMFCILAGAFVGGEFGFSTLRLVLMRGTTRLQLVLAQVATLAIYALLAVALMLLLGLLSGSLFGLLLGISPSSSAGVSGEVANYGLAMALSLLLYALLAFFFSVLGRSVAVGIGVGLGALFIEGNVLDGIFYLIGTIPNSPVASFFGHIPEWLPVENTSLLMAHAGASPLTLDPLNAVSPYFDKVDSTHALLVTVVYCVVFVGLSYLLLRQRDVRE